MLPRLGELGMEGYFVLALSWIDPCRTKEPFLHLVREKGNYFQVDLYYSLGEEESVVLQTKARLEGLKTVMLGPSYFGSEIIVDLGNGNKIVYVSNKLIDKLVNEGRI